jgi:hypothetical protein
MGDGVNIAARLEGVAKPVAICLSEDAYRQVKARLDLKVSDLGLTRLKNIAEPMNVYAIEVGVPAQSEPARHGQPSPSGAAKPAPARWRSMALGGAFAVAMFTAGAYAPRFDLAHRMFGSTGAAGMEARAPSAPVSSSTNLVDDRDHEFLSDEIGYDQGGAPVRSPYRSANGSRIYRNQSVFEEYRVRRTLGGARLGSKLGELDADRETGGSEEVFVRRRVNTLASEQMNASPPMSEPSGPPDLAISTAPRLPNNPLSTDERFLRIRNDR